MGLGDLGPSRIADSKYKQLLEEFCCKGKKIALEWNLVSQLCFVFVVIDDALIVSDERNFSMFVTWW